MVPPIPELTSGWKVKGTETCGHTMKEIGTSLMTDKSILIMHAVLKKTRLRTLAGAWWVPRIGLHKCWDAARAMLTKALPALSLPTFSPILFPSPYSQITQHTRAYECGVKPMADQVGHPQLSNQWQYLSGEGLQNPCAASHHLC